MHKNSLYEMQMKCRRLVLFVCLPLFLFFVTNVCAAEVYPAMHYAGERPTFQIQRYPEEGFGAGTLVCVPNGYKPIEILDVHDIVLDNNLRSKQILKIARRIADRCIRLTVDGQSICIGYEQCVRVAHNMGWQKIGSLDEQQYVLDAHHRMQRIDEYELIPEVTVLYQLVVEDHIFCIGPSDIIVHNADVATVGVAMLFLEYVAYAHPVVALIGSTIALSTIARQAYKAWQQSRQHTNSDGSADQTVPQEIFLTEHYYYEQRKKELTTLRDEFAGIYRSITAMKELFHPQINTFSSQLLQHTTQHHTPSNLLRISIADELKLSDDRKTVLRNAREQEFALLEKEISELHALLVVHFNELMRHVNEAHDAYYEALPTINHAIDVWNANLASTTDSIASSSYEQNIREECLLNTIKQATAELKIIVTYYQRNQHLACLKQSTDIIERVDRLHQAIIDTEQWVSQELTRVTANQRNDEHYFAQRTIPTAEFKNQVKNAFYKDRANKNAQALKKAKNELTNICTSGGPNDPKKPKDDDKDDFFKKLKLRSDKKVRTNRFGNMYRDPATKLWWAKDLAKHGGSCYKVFKETATAFEWVFNADNVGNKIVGQHKSAIGIYIPFKDVIWKT